LSAALTSESAAIRLERSLSAGSDPSRRDETDGLRLVDDESLETDERVLARDESERREQDDRRDAPTRGWDSLFGFYRRRKGRRDGESENIYVDSYTRQDVALTVGVLILNILDAFFTLRWLEMGGGEGNPLMEMLIRANDMLFLLQKCIVVGLWLIVLVIHKNFRIARLGLWGAFILYVGILLYHFVLQTTEPRPVGPVSSSAVEATAPVALSRTDGSGCLDAIEDSFDLG
jgi:hypothetical protein